MIRQHFSLPWIICALSTMFFLRRVYELLGKDLLEKQGNFYEAEFILESYKICVCGFVDTGNFFR